MKEKVRGRDSFAAIESKGRSLLTFDERHILALRKAVDETTLAVSRCQRLIDEQTVLLEGWKYQAADARQNLERAMKETTGRTQ